MDFSHLGKNRKGGEKKLSGRNEDGNVNADNIPGNSREIVQNLKEIVNRSEQEIYAMLVECNMDADEAINRLLSQDGFQEVKSKRDKKKEAKDIMGRRYVDSNVNTDNILENSREVVQNLKEIVNCSEQEIYAMLLDCNMDADEAINRLLSQDGCQEVKSKRDKKKKAKEKSMIGRGYVDSNVNTDNVLYLKQMSKVINGFGSETSNVQGIRNHLSGSSTTAGILGPYPSLNSDVSNVETKGVTISSGEAVPSLSVPSSRCGTSGQETVVDVVKMGLDSSKDSVTKATVKDDSLLPEKPVVPNSFSNSFTESASVSNQKVRDGDYGCSRLLCDNYNNKNDETYQVQRRSIEHNQTKDPLVLVNLDTAAIKELHQLRFGRFTGMNGSGEPSGLPSRFLDNDSEDIFDCADDLSLSNLSIRDGECHEEEEERLRRNVGNEQMAYPMNSNAARNYHSYSNYDQTEPTQESQYNSSSATYTFDNSQLFNPVEALSSLQMQNLSNFPNAMHQQAYIREPDACYSASPLNQSVLTAISLGRKLSVSMIEAPLIASINEPQMNQHYPQPNVPSGHSGSMRNYPYSLPTQNNTYYTPTSAAYQQHGGSNNNVYHLPSIVAPLPQYINSDLRDAHNSAHRSGSAYASGMSSYNAANSRLEYVDALSPQFMNHLKSLLNGNSSDVWTPAQGHNDSRRNHNSLLPGHQNQQLPSFIHRQQQQEQPYRGTGYENERSSGYYASLDQQNNRRDPSNPTQQHLWPRNNY